MVPWRYYEHTALSVFAITSIAITFRAYLYEDEALFWDLSGLVGAFHSGRKAVNETNEIQKERAGWKSACECVGLQWGHEYQYSVKQLRAIADLQATQYTRSTQIVGTRLALCILLRWAVNRKSSLATRGQCMFECMCLTFAPVEDCQAYDFQGFWHAGVHFCPQGCAEGCPHLPSLQAFGVADDFPNPAAWLAAALLHCFGVAHECMAARHMACVLIGFFGKCIESGLEKNFVPMESHKIQPRWGRKRKRPAEDTYKLGLSRDVMTSKKAKNGKVACQLDGYHASTQVRWHEKDNAAYVVASARLMPKPARVLGLFEDGARFGKPAKEHRLHAVWHADAQKGCMLMPQVSSGCPDDHQREFSKSGPRPHTIFFSCVSRNTSTFLRRIARYLALSSGVRSCCILLDGIVVTTPRC